jgi:hypothetical protein
VQFEIPPDGYEEQFVTGSEWRYTSSSRTSSSYVEVVGVLYDATKDSDRDADLIVTVNRGSKMVSHTSEQYVQGRLYMRRRYEMARKWEPRPQPRPWTENTVYTVKRPSTGPNLICSYVFGDGSAVLVDPVAGTAAKLSADSRADFKTVRAHVPPFEAEG